MPEKPAGNHTENAFVEILVAVGALLLVAALLRTFITSVFGNYVAFIDWLYSKNWRRISTILMIIFGIVDIALASVAVLIVRWYSALMSEEPVDSKEAIKIVSPQQEFHENWQDIQSLLSSNNPSDWNMAILRADAQLEDVLNHLGYDGETIAERLKIVDPTKLISLDRVWSAHRLRNAIAHDPLQQLTRETLTHALQSYEFAFKELGFLKEAPMQ